MKFNNTINNNKALQAHNNCILKTNVLFLLQCCILGIYPICIVCSYYRQLDISRE